MRLRFAWNADWPLALQSSARLQAEQMTPGELTAELEPAAQVARHGEFDQLVEPGPADPKRQVLEPGLAWSIGEEKLGALAKSAA